MDKAPGILYFKIGRMQKTNFDQAVEQILREDQRFDPNAYRFVREGLDFTLKQQKRHGGSGSRHVSGPELLDGLRQYTLKEFGPMAKVVLNEWGITRCEDFGQIVFNLVQKGVLGKSDSDRVEDFSEIFTFEEAFVKPFLPPVPMRGRAPRKGKSARPRRRLKKGTDNSIPSSASE